MRYAFVAIPDEEVPAAADPTLHHLVVTYASETNKTVGIWRAVPEELLDFKPHEKMNTIRSILVHLYYLHRVDPDVPVEESVGAV
jgi:hypothetical protein